MNTARPRNCYDFVRERAVGPDKGVERVAVSPIDRAVTSVLPSVPRPDRVVCRMLRMTQEQIRFLQYSAWEVFVAEMVKHMWTFAPNHCRVIGEAQVRRVVGLGLERAKAYGFTYRGPLRFYLELMFMFGAEFDSDPQFPSWARDLLRLRTVDDQMYRADRIYRGLSDFHDRAVARAVSWSYVRSSARWPSREPRSPTLSTIWRPVCSRRCSASIPRSSTISARPPTEH